MFLRGVRTWVATLRWLLRKDLEMRRRMARYVDR